MTEAETAVREALAKMTPGEWRFGGMDGDYRQIDALYLLDAAGKRPAITGCGPTSAANAAGIVALRNHTPALLAELDAARAENERLREIENIAKRFCERVEAGQVRSVTTYNAFRAALEASHD